MKTVQIPILDYERLLKAAMSDDTIVICETCGAWLSIDEAATTVDFTGCWKAATCDSQFDDTCKSYRATLTE